MTLTHGGRLLQAARQYGIGAEHWLDLSTGISPWSWPVPQLPASVWQRLPEDDDDLLPAAANYYGCLPQQLLAVPGSQYAIRQLPRLIAAHQPGAVALPLVGYQEHARCWQVEAQPLLFYHNIEQLTDLVEAGQVRHAVVINPNNPTAERATKTRLRQLADNLHAADGMLLLDEAFMDCESQHSLVGHDCRNLLVLRSLGKFFGLAGVRLGFVYGNDTLLTALAAELDPWAVNHPARWIGASALTDADWQAQQRARLQEACLAWQQQLQHNMPGLQFTAGGLFVSAELDLAQGQRLYQAAVQQGLLLRLAEPWPVALPPAKDGANSTAVAPRAVLRLGLPHETQQRRIDAILPLLRHCL